MALRSCPKCDGSGIIRQYGHIKGGVCFKCDGSGVVHGKSPTKAERAELEALRPKMKEEKERLRIQAQEAREKEMAETGGLGPILFAAMRRINQEAS